MELGFLTYMVALQQLLHSQITGADLQPRRVSAVNGWCCQAETSVLSYRKGSRAERAEPAISLSSSTLLRSRFYLLV